MNKTDNRTNSAKESATSARTTEPTVTTYRNALEATGVNLLGWLDEFLPDEATNDEYYRLLDELAGYYDLIDEEGELIDFYSAYVTDATPGQVDQLRTNYDTIYIAYSAEIGKYVLLTDWCGCSMDIVTVTVRNTQVA